jgi:hypothetical protein
VSNIVHGLLTQIPITLNRKESEPPNRVFLESFAFLLAGLRSGSTLRGMGLVLVVVGGGARVGNNGVNRSGPGGEDGVDIPPGVPCGRVVAVKLSVERLTGAREPRPTSRIAQG